MNNHKHRYDVLQKLIDTRLRSLIRGTTPRAVNDACRYALAAGGKRIRPALLILSCEAVGGRARDAIDAGTAIEIVHNFTLVHDDVMDHAPSRRGRPTVHKKWDLNTALLAGDVLLAYAYKQILKTPVRNARRLLDVFTDGFLTVCEGQALDLEFERRSNVTLQDYFSMIEKKTGRLITASTQLGALIGNGSERQVRSLAQFGHYLGRAFQLQDDVLDVIAEERRFGKTIGGDIIEGKKTFLLLKAMEKSRGNDKARLLRVVNRRAQPPNWTRARKKEEIRQIAAIYESTGAIAEAQKRIAADTAKAIAEIRTLPPSPAHGHLQWLAKMLLERSS